MNPATIGSSAPGHYGGPGNELLLFETTIECAWNVQGEPGRTGFLDAVRRAFEIDLPLAPNTTARGGALVVYWIGPGSWLIASGAPSLTDFTAKRDALNAAGGALFDLSQSRVAYTVAGARAPAVLASGCPIDFSASAFPPGACRQSVFHRVGALFERPTDPLYFRMLVPRSYARDVWHGLCLTGAEHGYEVRTSDRLA